MRVSILAAASLVVLTACSSIGTPHAPVAVTGASRRCVDQCQALHDRCMARAYAAQADYWSFANPLVDACNNQLGRCYATCTPG
jgi:hypothetical protein